MAGSGAAGIRGDCCDRDRQCAGPEFRNRRGRRPLLHRSLRFAGGSGASATSSTTAAGGDRLCQRLLAPRMAAPAETRPSRTGSCRQRWQRNIDRDRDRGQRRHQRHKHRIWWRRREMRSVAAIAAGSGGSATSTATATAFGGNSATARSLRSCWIRWFGFHFFSFTSRAG